MARKARYILSIALIFLLLIIAGLSASAAYCYRAAKMLLHPLPVETLTDSEATRLQARLDELYPQRTSHKLSSLPYTAIPTELTVNAASAILIDCATGSILWEKNADAPIPPASLTKIVEMYVIFEAVERGEVRLDDEVPLPPQSWSVNLPFDASRMYLNKGQHVTLRELLLGLAIASGNDASIAAAYYICGNMEDFVARMNSAVKEAGLEHTHFVESSGYSEKNTTTAREFATFARLYISKYPWSLTDFHSVAELRYPLERNLPESQRFHGDSLAIVQKNTNKLLDKIVGCDGLKTGFIDESGYNISVTAEQNGTRFLAVTLRGPGHSTAEGNKYRVEDNLALFTYAFAHYADYRPDHHTNDADAQHTLHEFTVGIAAAEGNAVRLVPAYDENFTVPFIEGDSPTGAAASIHVSADIPDCLYGAVSCGTVYGTLSYTLGNTLLRTVPLVADRDIPASQGLAKLSGTLVFKAIRLYQKYQRKEGRTS